MIAGDDIREVAKVFNVTPADIIGRRRTRHIHLARCAVIARLSERGWSSPRIGYALHRHHTTILSAMGRLNRGDVR